MSEWPRSAGWEAERSRRRENTPPPLPRRASTNWLIVIAVAAVAWLAGALMNKQPEPDPAKGDSDPADKRAAVAPPPAPQPPPPVTRTRPTEPEASPAPRNDPVERPPAPPEPEPKPELPAPPPEVPIPPLPKPMPGKPAGKFGTRIAFAASPAEAARTAAKERKLLFILHYAGNYEDGGFACANTEALRANALADDQVADYLNENFASAAQRVGAVQFVNGQKIDGNVASYFCRPDGSVLHAVPGPVDAWTFLREARWAAETAKRASVEAWGDQEYYRDVFQRAHGMRLQGEYGVALGFDLPERDGARAKTRPVSLGPDGLPRLVWQGQAHWILYHQPLAKLERVSPLVWERVLRQRFTDKPVIEWQQPAQQFAPPQRWGPRAPFQMRGVNAPPAGPPPRFNAPFGAPARP